MEYVYNDPAVNNGYNLIEVIKFLQLGLDNPVSSLIGDLRLVNFKSNDGSEEMDELTIGIYNDCECDNCKVMDEYADICDFVKIIKDEFNNSSITSTHCYLTIGKNDNVMHKEDWHEYVNLPAMEGSPSKRQDSHSFVLTLLEEIWDISTDTLSQNGSLLNITMVFHRDYKKHVVSLAIYPDECIDD